MKACVWYVGQKYQFAVKWNINVVTPKWLHDSVKAGHSLAVSGYRLAGTSSSSHTTSTPTNDKGSFCVVVNFRNVSLPATINVSVIVCCMVMYWLRQVVRPLLFNNFGQFVYAHLLVTPPPTHTHTHRPF